MESSSANSIQKFNSPEFVVAESKFVLEIENFRNYAIRSQPITSATVDFFDCDIEWLRIRNYFS